MKGLILVTDNTHGTSVLGVEGLRPLVGRPFVAHVMEQFVAMGLKEIDVVLDTWRPLDYERTLGTGERYGATVRYHLVRDPGRPGSQLRRFRGPVLLALAHRLVHVSPLLDSPAAPSRPIIWCSTEGSSTQWSGWAALPEGALVDIPDQVTVPELGDRLLALGKEQGLLPAVHPLLAADDAASLLAAQDVGFHADFLQKRGKTLQGDVRIGRAVIVDPTARLIGPVFLGDQVRIGAGAVIGPHAFVGAGAVIGRDTVLRHAVVTRRTSVGEQLDIEQAIVSPAGIAHARRAVELRVNDPFILSSINQSPFGLRAPTHRAAAALMLAATAPLALVVLPGLALSGYRPRRESVQGLVGDKGVWRLRKGSSSEKREDVPSVQDFFTRVLPALLSVVAGRLDLVGREPVPPQGSEALPAGWSERLADLRPGVISAAMVDGDPSPLVRHLSDLAFGSTASIRSDLRLLGRYFAAAVKRLARRRGERLAAQDAAWAVPAAARIRN